MTTPQPTAAMDEYVDDLEAHYARLRANGCPDNASVVQLIAGERLCARIREQQETLDKQLNALASLLCWAGEPPDGPTWATPEAKRRNREMFETAVREANALFPSGWEQSAAADAGRKGE